MNFFLWLFSGNSFVFFNISEFLFFVGENIFFYFFDIYFEFILLKGVVNKFVEIDDWIYIYDKEQFVKNEVFVYVVIYVDDLYVDYEYFKEIVEFVKGVKIWEINVISYFGLRINMVEVLVVLFNLWDNVMDQ